MARCQSFLCLNSIPFGLPRWLSSKESTCWADVGLFPGSGRSPGEGNGNPLQYSCLENPMDRGAWWTTVHGGLKRVGPNWAHTHTKALKTLQKIQFTICYRSLIGRYWPGGLQSLRSLESDTTEWLHFHFSLSCIGEGNGNLLQCSCLENLRDGEVWWAAISAVAQSRTRLKWLNSNSNSSTTIFFLQFPKPGTICHDATNQQWQS